MEMQVESFKEGEEHYMDYKGHDKWWNEDVFWNASYRTPSFQISFRAAMGVYIIYYI